MMADPTRMIQQDHPALAQTLVHVLRKIREDRIKTLVKSPAKDYADYRFACGVIEGLDIAIAQAELVDSRLKA